MSATTINLLLWAPFVLVVLVSGTLFCIRGYKTGLWRSLVSLGCTLVSTGLALLLAKVISRPLQDAAAGMVSGALGDELAFAVRGIAGALTALALFFVLFFLLTLITKLIAGAVKAEALDKGNDQPGMKWGGLGVRLVDALVFTILLLLPIYGTLAAYMPTVEKLYVAMSAMDGGGTFSPVLSAENDAQGCGIVTLGAPAARADARPLAGRGGEDPVLEAIRIINRHPVVAMAALPPFQGVYSGLSSVSTEDGGSINLAATADACSELLTRFDAFANGPDNQRKANLLRLFDFIRDNVLNEDWFYTLCTDGIKESYKAIVKELDGSGTDAVVRDAIYEFYKRADMPKAEFVKNMQALIDALELFCDALGDDLAPKTTLDTDDPAFFAKLGGVLNATEEMVAVKKLMYSYAFTSSKFAGGWSPEDLFTVDMCTGTDAQAQDAAALARMMAGPSTRAEMLETLLMIPGAKPDAIERWYNG